LRRHRWPTGTRLRTARKHKERQEALRAQGKDRALDRTAAKAMTCGGSTAQLDDFRVPDGERVH
jgi:hypothetical protein